MVVSVTGNAWTHAGSPIPVALKPELWFRPNHHNLNGNRLVAGLDVKATLTPSTGAFVVEIEASPSIRYRPWMRWLVNPAEQAPDRWAWGYAEWPFEVNPYPYGGSIEDLAVADLTYFNVLVDVEDPPDGYRGWWLHSGPGDPDDVLESGTGDLRRVTG